jgi:hypothetical protein
VEKFIEDGHVRDETFYAVVCLREVWWKNGCNPVKWVTPTGDPYHSSLLHLSAA